MKITKLDALTSLSKGTAFSFNKGALVAWDITDIKTHQTQPTDAEIQAEVLRLQAEYDSQEYARNRKAEYDKLNQFEMQFDDQLNGTTTWVDAINAIKQEFPK